MSEFLPCPFCGGKASFVKRDVEPQGDTWYGKKVEEFVECQECSACLFDGCFHEGFYEKDKAISAWNTRSQVGYSNVASELEKLRSQLVRKTDGLERIKRGATDVLLTASLNDEPIARGVLELILNDARTALSDEQWETK